MLEKIESKVAVVALIVLTFLLVQWGASSVWYLLSGLLAWYDFKREGEVADLSGLFCQAMLFTHVVALMAAFLLGVVRRSDFAWPRLPRLMAWRMLLGLVLICFALNVLSELVALPDVSAQVVMSMLSSPLGMVCIAVGAPLAEECFFRAGIMGHLLRRGVSPTWAIGISALLFGLIHLNPAQVPFACLVGAALGYVYYRTRNLWLTIAAHAANNSMVVVLYAILGSERFTQARMIDFMGGPWLGTLLATLLGACGLWLLARGASKP